VVLLAGGRHLDRIDAGEDQPVDVLGEPTEVVEQATQS
jgi:hypothetical protein